MIREYTVTVQCCTCVGAFVTCSLCACTRGVPRKRHAIVYARVLRGGARELLVSSVRSARCAPLTVRVAIVTTHTYACAARSLYRRALPSEFRLACFFSFIARNSAGFSPLVSASFARFCCLCSRLLPAALSLLFFLPSAPHLLSSQPCARRVRLAYDSNTRI